MAKYFDRDAAWEYAKQYYATRIEGLVRNHALTAFESCNLVEFGRGYEKGAMDAMTAILSNAVAVDAEVVTRCKDCKYFKIVNERLDSWGCSVLFDPYGRPLISLADDFCSYAEPKARDEE